MNDLTCFQAGSTSTSTRKVVLPRGGTVIQEFAEHMAADVKQLVEEEATGAKSFRYVKTGTNHYSLAFTYECIAASRYQPIDLSMCGWFGCDRDFYSSAMHHVW